MNAPSSDPSLAAPGALLGPAVSPRATNSSPGFAALTDPLAPFRGPAAAGAPALGDAPVEPVLQPLEHRPEAAGDFGPPEHESAPEAAAVPEVPAGKATGEPTHGEQPVEEQRAAAGPQSDPASDEELEDTASWLLALQSDFLSEQDDAVPEGAEPRNKGAGHDAVPHESPQVSEGWDEPELDVLEPWDSPRSEPAQQSGAGETAAPETVPSRAEPLGQESEQVPAASTPGEPALEEVAERLERIARSLRDRSPSELLTEASDPLQMLIAGYALGLVQARRVRPGSTAPDQP